MWSNVRPLGGERPKTAAVDPATSARGSQERGVHLGFVLSDRLARREAGRVRCFERYGIRLESLWVVTSHSSTQLTI
jgi:hypothetical protein